MVTALQGGPGIAGSSEPALVTDTGALRRAATVAATVVKIAAVAGRAITRVDALSVRAASGSFRAVGVVDAVGQARALLARQMVRTGSCARAGALPFTVTDTGWLELGLVNAERLLAGSPSCGGLAAAVWRPARRAHCTAGVVPARLSGVPCLVPGVVLGFVPGAGSVGVDAGERA